MVWFLEKIRFDLYSSVMGITGLGLAWRFAAQYFQISGLIGLFAASLIVVLIGCYAMRYFLSCFKILRINKAISQYDQR